MTFIDSPNALLTRNSLVIPAYVAVASAFVLLFHLSFASFLLQKLLTRILRVSLPQEPIATPELVSGERRTNLRIRFKECVSEHGGLVTFAFKGVRLLACLALCGLAAITPIIDESGLDLKAGDTLSSREQMKVIMCITYFYASCLTFATMSTKRQLSKIATWHVNFLTFVAFSVYCYRDLYPLATYTKTSIDMEEGWIMWAKIVLLALTGIVIPLFIPRRYQPVDPKNPMSIPNPEQIASILSLAFYSFLDPIVFLAYKSPHLSFDQLPPLADYDYAKNLVANSFPYLDVAAAGRKHHIFFGLLRVFCREYIILSLTVIAQVISSFVAPLGINRVLNYLETGDEISTLKPWFWILCLSVGPILASVTFEWYFFIANRTAVRMQGIITQLVFEHSLRIRMKAEISEQSIPVISPLALTSTSDHSAVNQESSGDEDVNLHSQADNESTTVQSERETVGSRFPQSSVNATKSNSSNLIGKINNLVTSDLDNIVNANIILVVLHTPLQIVFSIAFLYVLLGWSAFVGLAVMIILFPVPSYITKFMHDVIVVKTTKADARVQTVTEAISVLRMIKLFGWERKMCNRIYEKREEELLWIWKRQILELASSVSLFLIPVISMLVTYITYCMPVFDMLREHLHSIFFYLRQSVTGKVSLERVNDFLENTELLDSFSDKIKADHLSELPVDSHRIGFRDMSFTWSDEDISASPAVRNFVLRIDGEVIFKLGCINLIIGPTGPGKTSILMALLGPTSWFNIPRDDGVAYAAQESWVQNETIKDNIIFGAPFDEERYNKVIYQCCLERDLQNFEAGDETEVGEKGLTLSGGQKARVTLARAIYSQAKVILLDDVLAALDVHTAKWIIQKCLSGDLIRGRTVLLVTHNIAMTRSIAGFVVSVDFDGKVEAQGEISDAIDHNPTLAHAIEEEMNIMQKAEEQLDSLGPTMKANGKLIVAEEMEEGHVSWSNFKLYFSGLGGDHPVLFFVTLFTSLFITEIGITLQTWYLGYWGSQYDHKRTVSDAPAIYYLKVYGCLVLAGIFLYCLSKIIFTFATRRASRSVHKQLVDSILGTTFRWLDITPASRIIARCTQDISIMDGPIGSGLLWIGEMSMTLIVKFGAIVWISPIFAGPGVLLAIFGGWCAHIYMASQLSVKREMSNVRSPVLGHFGASIAGLVSIRAFAAQQQFSNESLLRIDRYTRAARTFFNLNRWISIRFDALGGMFAASLATYLVYLKSETAVNTGFSLNMAVGFSSTILHWVNMFNQTEVQGNSLERIKRYIEIEQEPKPTSDGVPAAYWPSSGAIQVKNMSARYSVDGPRVLRGVSFNIRSGERVGVVGRTGSGKSTLTLSLLRCIFTEGSVYYDGIDTSKINLDALRSNVTIIPQIPELLSGTLRQNLDPFEQYDDLTLNNALRSAGLFALQSEVYDGMKITLDTAIANGGSNLSVGQRQILALARAIVRGSKLLILDEATSAIDHKTDTVIQSSLRHEIGSDVTLITVAHRLQTVMDADKIMVLDAGQIVEFDSPRELLKRKDGKLRALVEESGDKLALYAMAEGSQS